MIYKQTYNYFLFSCLYFVSWLSNSAVCLCLVAGVTMFFLKKCFVQEMRILVRNIDSVLGKCLEPLVPFSFYDHVSSSSILVL